MANRKLDTVQIGAFTARVYFNAEHAEYVVKFDVNGNHRPSADYHTDSKQDAYATAVCELRSMSKVGCLGLDIEHTEDGTSRLVYIEGVGKETRFYAPEKGQDAKAMMRHLRGVAKLALADARRGEPCPPTEGYEERARRALMAVALLESQQ